MTNKRRFGFKAHPGLWTARSIISAAATQTTAKAVADHEQTQKAFVGDADLPAHAVTVWGRAIRRPG